MDPSRSLLLSDADALVAYLDMRLPESHAPDVAEGLPENPHQAAVLAPLYAVRGQPHLIFTRRTTTLKRHSGEISFPGGSRDHNDPSPLDTALRETREELALDTARIRTLGALPYVYAAVSNFLVAPYVGWLGEGVPALRPNPHEVDEVIHAPLAALADPRIFHEEIWTRGGVAHIVYFFDYGHYRIWGLTGRILRSLLAVLPEG